MCYCNLQNDYTTANIAWIYDYNNSITGFATKSIKILL